jgi:hypothetical protein
MTLPAAPGSLPVTALVGTLSMRVGISQAAPPGGLVINLSSSEPAVATVPPTVTIPAGSTTALFPVTHTGSGRSMILASSSSDPRTVVSNAFGRLVTGVSGPLTVSSGNSATWTVTLDNVASSSLTVDLKSSNPALATVPASVVIPQGASSATFSVTVVNASAGTTNITASMIGSSKTAGPFGYSVTSLSGPPTLATGSVATWTVTLNAPAPSSGVTVNLQSSNPSAATVPATVTVPGGASTANFDVTVVDPLQPQITITAAITGSSQTGTFGYLEMLSTSIVAVGTTVNSVARLNGGVAPPGGFVIALQNPHPEIVTAPASVTIPEGASSANYPLTGISVGSVALGHRLGSRPFRNTIVRVLPGVLGIAGAEVPGSGTSASWTVTLNAVAPSGGANVNLSSSNSAAATVPAAIIVPAGATTASFDVTMLDPLAPPTTITASSAGTSQSGLFGYRIIQHSAPSVPLGGTGTAVVVLNGNAPANGLLITLDDQFPDRVAAPASFTIAAGSSSGTYPLTGLSTGADIISARIGPNGAPVLMVVSAQ